jgi:hypothetical protein
VLHSGSHRQSESLIARDTAAQDYALTRERSRAAPRLFNQRLDQRLLKRARDVGFVGFEIR